MDILCINYELPPIGGGAGNATACLAKEMAGLGARVTVLTSAFGLLPARETIDGYRVERIKTGRRYADRCSVPEMTSFMLRAIPAALGLAKKQRFDACIAFFGIPGGPAAWVLSRLRGLPYLVSLRGGDVPGFQPYDLSFFHAATRPAIRAIWRRAAFVVANSRGLAGLAQQTAPELTFPVIANGVDTERFLPGPPPAPGRPLRLLFVGRVARQKGLDVLFAALAALPGDLAWTLAIAGDGPEAQNLAAQAARLSIADRIEFLGWRNRDALPGIYAAADAFVFPSRDEGMPNAVLEAMSCALPVVATDIAGNEELVTHERTGLLVPAEDAPGLALALTRLIREPQAARAMGAAGRERVAACFSWRAAAAAYLDLCEKAAKTAGR